jgi:protein-L-isoaspartate(D-aspartate) O-methyltransferase
MARIPNFTMERERMVQALIEEGLLKTPAIIEAIRKVPRELFVSVHLQQYAYADTPLPTEYGQTISAPLG